MSRLHAIIDDWSAISDQEKSARLITYGAYIENMKAIQHFDGIQFSLRNMTSKVLLGIFAVIGFVILGGALNVLPLQGSLIAAMIATLGIIIITVFGWADMIFQEHLLVGNIWQAASFEKLNPWLPPVYLTMLEPGKHSLSSAWKGVFYVGVAAVLFLILGLSLLIYFRKDPLLYDLLFIGLSIVCVTAVYAYFFLLIPRAFDKILRLDLFPAHLSTVKSKVDRN